MSLTIPKDGIIFAPAAKISNYGEARCFCLSPFPQGLMLWWHHVHTVGENAMPRLVSVTFSSKPLESMQHVLWGTILALCLMAAPLWGQGSAYLTGFISDSSGAAVAGATVVIRDVQTDSTYQLKSNETG